MSDNPEEPAEFVPGEDDDAWSELSKIPGLPEEMKQYLSPNGELDMTKLVGSLRSALDQAMAGTEASSGMNWQALSTAITDLIASQDEKATPTHPSSSLTDAFGLANRWLDEAMVFDGATLQLEVWSRKSWATATMKSWRSLSSPIIANIGDALVAMAGDFAPESAETMPDLSDLLAPMMRAMAAQFYSARLSQAIADLAKSTLSGTDAILPLVAPPTVALLPHNIDSFADGLAVPETDVQVFLLLRESARQRLFAATPWLGPQILALIEHYSREITIDPDVLREGFTVDNIENITQEQITEISKQIENRLFRPASTEEQQAILKRLEALICLVEGWVETVVNQAAGPWLASSAGLAESMQRRRAAQGPAERACASLFGLASSSRRVRDAANLWAYLEHERGLAARDELWRHPDLLPSADDLDDIMGFVSRVASLTEMDAMDAQLNWLVDQWRDNEA